MKQLRMASGLITVISLFLGVIWLSPALAVEAPVFVSLGQIRSAEVKIPAAMDLDEAGNLYVADARGGKVHTFNPYGELLRSFDLQAIGAGLAVTPDGTRLYVSTGESVSIVDAVAGTVLGSLTGAAASGPEFSQAREIDLDAAGNIFVADAGKLQVKAYDATGQHLTSFGSYGAGAGQFHRIGGMSFNPAGQLVVADSSSSNAKTHVFSLDAALNVTGVTSYSNVSAANFGSPLFLKPRGFAFDTQGRAYFLEYLRSQIRVADGNFNYLGAFVNVGYGVGQLNGVIDATFDAANSRLFVSSNSGRIEIFGIDGGQSPPPVVNTPPTTPAPQSPVAGSEVASANPTLVINNATDADGDALTYDVVVTEQGAVVFQADVAAEAGATTSVVVDVALAENTAFSWTAQASDGQDVSDVSVAASFVVNAVEEAPSVPELIAPANGESIGGQDALTWGLSTDPDPNDNNITYLVEVALDETFAQLVASEALAETALTLDAFAAYADLVDGTGYFWRVAAADEAQVTSAPSVAGQFIYDTAILTITANMPDAVVSFSGNHAYAGQVVGVAPIELRDMEPGTMSVVVERAGFEPFVASVTLGDKENFDFYAELVPALVVANRSPSKSGINGRSGITVSGTAVPFLVDFDNNGTLDLLVGDGSGQVMLFANMQVDSRNRLYFDQGVSLNLPVLPGAVPFVADWNNDGRKDLLVGLADGSVKLFINNGLEVAPAFGLGVDLQVAGSALSAGSNAAPAVVDYNSDGAKDLLVGNASGQLLVYLNQGNDEAPALAAPVLALQVSGAVVPLSVDWDADGQQELLLTAGGVVSVYAKVDGEYQVAQQFDHKSEVYAAAFPIDNAVSSGKQLLTGQVNGELSYLTGNSTGPVASFPVALQDKVSELAALVAVEAPELSGDVTAISALVAAEDYPSVVIAAEALASSLAAGAAQTSALELADLCR